MASLRESDSTLTDWEDIYILSFPSKEMIKLKNIYTGPEHVGEFVGAGNYYLEMAGLFEVLSAKVVPAFEWHYFFWPSVRNRYWILLAFLAHKYLLG